MVYFNELNIHFDGTFHAFWIFYLLHLWFALLMLFSYSFGTGWTNIKSGLKDNPDCNIVIYDSRLKMLFSILFYPIPGAIVKDQENARGLTLNFPEAFWGLYYFFSMDWRGAYHISFVIVSMMGAFDNPWFFVMTVFDIMRMNKVVQYVLRSVVLRLDQVLVTLFLAFLILYVFASYLFERSREDQVDLSFEDRTPEEGNLKSWFLLFVEYGLINPLLMNTEGDDADDVTHEIGPEHVEYIVFQIIYYLIINLVITAIISGIIIDTFAQMRSDVKEVQDDLVSTCFICDISPEEFEAHNISFQQHITEQHNVWKYVWLKMYLREKDKMAYNGTESYVAPLLEASNAKCFPIKKARVLEGEIKQQVSLGTLSTELSKVQDNLRTSGQENRRLIKMIEDMDVRMRKSEEKIKNDQYIVRGESPSISQRPSPGSGPESFRPGDLGLGSVGSRLSAQLSSFQDESGPLVDEL